MFLMQTVQTPWRPQLPLPREASPNDNNAMEKAISQHHHQYVNGMTNNSNNTRTNMNSNNNINSTASSKKWSLGKFFRRKKKEEPSESSSEEDRKAGFTPQKRKPKTKLKRTSKVGGFDHIVVCPFEANSHRDNDNLSQQQIGTSPPTNLHSNESLERRLRKERIRSARLYSKEVSSEEDEKSFNSASMGQFRSDESLGEQSNNSGSKRTRSARTERYLKRMSKTDELITPQLAQRNSRWQTHPIINTVPLKDDLSASVQSMLKPHASVRSLTSVSSVPLQMPHNQSLPDSLNHKYIANSHPNVNYGEYRPHIIALRDLKEKTPPAPPPRHPQRRLNLNNHEPRPLSYAFDKTIIGHHPLDKHVNSRCVSDERLWGPKLSIMPLPQRPSSAQTELLNRYEFNVRRHEPTNVPFSSAPMTTMSNIQPPSPVKQQYQQHQQPVQSHDLKYVTDLAPRSRRPIHIVKDETPTTEMPEFLKSHLRRNIENESKQSAFNFVKQSEKPQAARRTMTSFIPFRSDPFTSKVTSPTIEPQPVNQSRLSFLDRFKKSPDPNNNEVDNIVTGSLVIKPVQNTGMLRSNVIPTAPITTTTFPHGTSFAAKRDSFIDASKTKSMPNYYAFKQVQSSPMNKYEEHVAKKVSRQPSPEPKYNPRPPPMPPQRRVQSKRNSFTEDEYRKSTNLEDAINELEAIYESLKLGDENLLDRAERRDIPTPTKFNQQFLMSPEQDEDDEPTGEPDILLDDLVYRNLKHANSIPKILESQPPFGIPIGPIPPSPGTDYLHVSTNNTSKSMFVPRKRPDLISDDLAVRTLRKDDPTLIHSNHPKVEHIVDRLGKKQRATRTMSANIYNLIQRDAAKPSGGSLEDYTALDKVLSRARSLKDINQEPIDDHPSMLRLLQRERELSNLKQKTPEKLVGGAVFNLPSTLVSLSTNKPFVSSPPYGRAPISVPGTGSPSTSPEFSSDTAGIEQMLNAIAKEAKESSEKLSRDLLELQKAKEIPGPSNSKQFNCLVKAKMEDDIDNVSKSAQRYENMLIECTGPIQEPPKSPRRLRKETRLLNEIKDTAKAARTCEKVLGDVMDSRTANRKISSEGLKRNVESSTKKSPTVNRKYSPLSSRKPSPNSAFCKVESSPKSVRKPMPVVQLNNLQTAIIKKPTGIEVKNSILCEPKKSNPQDSKLSNLFNANNFGSSNSKLIQNTEVKKPSFDNEEASITSLLAKLEPESKKIGDIAERCMKQLSQLGDLHTKIVGKNAKPSISPRFFGKQYGEVPDYDNLNGNEKRKEMNETTIKDNVENNDKVDSREKLSDKGVNDEIDKIMEECTEEANKYLLTSGSGGGSKNVSSEEELNILLIPPSSKLSKIFDKSPTERLSSSLEEPQNKSSSDGSGPKSSSDISNRAKSNSLTSYNAQSSSDFVKSPSSSDYHLASEDIKTSSTTSCYAKSSSSTPAQPSTNPSPTSGSPASSVQQQLPTLSQAADDSESQYNSTEELAMIFGIKSPEVTGKNECDSADTATDNAPALASPTHDGYVVESLVIPFVSHQQQREQQQSSQYCWEYLDTIEETPDEDQINRCSPNHDDRYGFTNNIKFDLLNNHEIDISRLNRIESSSDSGNVSLNDFSLIEGQTVELPMPLIAEKYPFLSQIEIGTVEQDDIDQVTSGVDSISNLNRQLLTNFGNQISEVLIPINTEYSESISENRSNDDMALRRTNSFLSDNSTKFEIDGLSDQVSVSNKDEVENVDDNSNDSHLVREIMKTKDNIENEVEENSIISDFTEYSVDNELVNEIDVTQDCDNIQILSESSNDLIDKPEQKGLDNESVESISDDVTNVQISSENKDLPDNCNTVQNAIDITTTSTLSCNSIQSALPSCSNLSVQDSQKELIQNKSTELCRRQKQSETKNQYPNHKNETPDQSKKLSDSPTNRQSLLPIQHVLLACTVCMANNELFAIVVIIIAILTLLALILL